MTTFNPTTTCDELSQSPIYICLTFQPYCYSSWRITSAPPKNIPSCCVLIMGAESAVTHRQDNISHEWTTESGAGDCKRPKLMIHIIFTLIKHPVTPPCVCVCVCVCVYLYSSCFSGVSFICPPSVAESLGRFLQSSSRKLLFFMQKKLT